MKRFSKMVLGAIPATLTIGVAVKAIEDFFSKKKADQEKEDKMKAIEAEDKATNEAFEEFACLNGLNDEEFWYVNDSGYTPIFSYDSKINIEKLLIPRGYTLLKLIQPGGETSYALGKMLVAGGVSTHYHILAYLCDDWYDDQED